MVRIINIAGSPDVFATIAQWHWDEWGSVDPDGSLETWVEGLRQRNNTDRVPATYAAFIDKDIPVGSVVLVENDMDSHPELAPWLAGLFVLPRYRNQGFGTSLALHAMSEAQCFGATRLYLYTATATPLYEKIGWEVLFHEHYEGARVDVMSYDVNQDIAVEPMLGVNR